MVGLAEVGVLTADGRHSGGQLCPDRGSDQADEPAEYPSRQDEARSMDLARHHVGVDEDASADDAAHDNHGGVEQAQLPGEVRFGRLGEWEIHDVRRLRAMEAVCVSANCTPFQPGSRSSGNGRPARLSGHERFCASIFYYVTSDESAVDSCTIMVRLGPGVAVA